MRDLSKPGMLALSRKLSERIIVTLPSGEQMTLMVIEIRRQIVRLGFDAPKDWKIHREEVQKLVDAEKAE